MCAACVAQGTLYLGGAVGTLRLMAARAAVKRSATAASKPDSTAEPQPETASSAAPS